jgi:hypothetical protein
MGIIWDVWTVKDFDTVLAQSWSRNIRCNSVPISIIQFPYPWESSFMLSEQNLWCPNNIYRGMLPNKYHILHLFHMMAYWKLRWMLVSIIGSLAGSCWFCSSDNIKYLWLQYVSIWLLLFSILFWKLTCRKWAAANNNMGSISFSFCRLKYWLYSVVYISIQYPSCQRRQHLMWIMLECARFW